MMASRRFAALYFALALVFQTLVFLANFKGIQGDGIYYYSYTVSLLWDGDLDLQNQFDHPNPLSPAETMTNNVYFRDHETGRAFSLFNAGTGLLMIPSTALGRWLNHLRGWPPLDPFDIGYQKFAGYTSVILSSLALLMLFLILKRYYPSGTATVLPWLFLLGTNWLFYASAFASWSHVPALFLMVLMLWAFLNLTARKHLAAAAVFGLSGGISLTTRNFSALVFLLLFLAAGYRLLMASDRLPRRRTVGLLGLAAVLFAVGAAPQFALNAYYHGNPWMTSFQATSSAQKAYLSPEPEKFKALDPANLQFLYSNLTNSDDGLFYFHPYYLFGLLGLLFLRHRDKLFQRLISLLLIALYFFWFIDAAYFDNWFSRAAGSGFGHRRYLDMLPLFLFGAANVLEWSRQRRYRKLLVSLVYALAAAAAVSLLYSFLVRYQELYAVRDSILGLYGYLLGSWPGIICFVIVFVLLLAVSHSSGPRETARPQSLPVIVLMLALIVLPGFVFRGSPEKDRERFQAKGGFFLMSSLTPYVQMSGRDWGFPENAARPLLHSPAAIRLPAPLIKGDILQFKVTPPKPSAEAPDILSVRLGGESIGKIRLGPGRQVCQFPVQFSALNQRTITIATEDGGNGSPSVLFHEGRVVFADRDEPPFGHIDLPVSESVVIEDRVRVEGWALDDRGVETVLLKREPLSSEEGISLDEDGLITLGPAEFKPGARPDVESTYVLYPFIDRAGWVFWLERRLLPEGKEGRFVVHAIARATTGQSTDIGKREIVVKERGPDE
jgi:hypothetical protein